METKMASFLFYSYHQQISVLWTKSLKIEVAAKAIETARLKIKVIVNAPVYPAHQVKATGKQAIMSGTTHQEVLIETQPRKAPIVSSDEKI
jgi:hypothetical protein